MFTIAFRHILADDGIVARTQTGREFQVNGRVIYFVHLNGYHLLQLTNLLLHLNGLGRLIAEALNELAHVLHLLLLVLVGTQLLFAPFLAQHDILVVLDLIVDNLSAGYFQRPVAYIIYKRTVVAHQHHGRSAVGKELFQPLYGLDVKMVRRLVQQQHVRTLQQYLCQLYPHAPTARELARGTVEVRTFKAKTHQRTFQLRLLALCTNHQVAFMLLCVAFDQRHVVITLVVSTLAHLTLQLIHALLQG